MSEKARGKSKVVPPYALALVVCDAIWRDPATGKRTILGCFSTIMVKEFPATLPGMCVYAAITDGHGKTPLVLRLVDVNEEVAPVFELKAEASFTDPRAVMEMDFMARGIVFPKSGEYRLQLACGEETLMERRILVCTPGDMQNAAGEQPKPD